MESWFTVNKIDDQTFAISELETHCYLVLGQEKAALIDTGLGVCNIKNVVDSLTELPIIVLTTHVHWDHIGGHRYFDNVAVHEAEKEWLSSKFPLSLEDVKKNLIRISCCFPKEFNIDNYQIFRGVPKTILYDGDVVDLGGRKIQTIHTPGHSPGHCCFYETEKKCLYSGDLIYKGCLYAFYPTTSPQLFYKSIKRIKKYSIEKVLPGHHELNISTSLISKIESGFSHLDSQGKLKQGKGLFAFKDFQIKI